MTDSASAHPGKTVIALAEGPSSIGADVAGLRPADEVQAGVFGEAMQLLWDSLMNVGDRPAKTNASGQYPLIRLYDSGVLCAVKYIGMDELLGTEILCKFTYSRAGELQVRADTDMDALLGAINEQFEKEGLSYFLDLTG
jgi:hypothetical protein